MRKTISMRCMIASDAACIVGGFIAAVLVVHLLQNANVRSLQDASVEWQETLRSVNRTGKSDRLFLSFEDRFGQQLSIADDALPRSGGDPSARRPGATAPTGNNTIVPKGVVMSGEPAKATGAPLRAPQPGPSPIKAEGCDPLASPLVEPDLARFVGRCLTELPIEPRNNS
jgi:hypothetical protein